MSLRGADRRRFAKWRHSPMFQATRRAARPWTPWAGSRARERGAGRRTGRRRNGTPRPPASVPPSARWRPCGPAPPWRRRRRRTAPRGCPTPCAISSTSGSCLWPVMPSATTADRSDSIAPSIAMAKAEGARARMRSKLRPIGSPFADGQVPGQDGEGRLAGDAGQPRARRFVGEAGVDGREPEVGDPARHRERGHARHRQRDQRRRPRGGSPAARRSSSGEREEPHREVGQPRAGQGPREGGHALEVQLRHVARWSGP